MPDDASTPPIPDVLARAVAAQDAIRRTRLAAVLRLHPYIELGATPQQLEEAFAAIRAAFYPQPAPAAPRRRGRHRGTGTYRDGAAFLAILTPIVTQLKALHQTPTQRRVATDWPDRIHVRTLQDWFAQHVAQPYGIDWKTFVRDYA